MTTTTLDQIRVLEAQKAELVEAAREEAMSKVTEGIDTLEALGYQYTLVAEKKQKVTRARKRSGRPRADRDCPICEFQTNPPHDGRHHKQQVEKAPFTAAELEERGMTIVGNEKLSTDQVSWDFEESALA